jgi:hypothetical protein
MATLNKWLDMKNAIKELSNATANNKQHHDIFKPSKIYCSISIALGIKLYDNPHITHQQRELIMINERLEKESQEQALLLNSNIESIQAQFESLVTVQTQLDLLKQDNQQLQQKVSELTADNAYYESLLDALLVSLQSANEKIAALRQSAQHTD